MCDGLKTVVIGEYHVEVKSTHWSGIHNNYWAQVLGPRGEVIARFGKPVPAYPGQDLRRAAAEQDALNYVAKLRGEHAPR